MDRVVVRVVSGSRVVRVAMIDVVRVVRVRVVRVVVRVVSGSRVVRVAMIDVVRVVRARVVRDAMIAVIDAMRFHRPRRSVVAPMFSPRRALANTEKTNRLVIAPNVRNRLLTRARFAGDVRIEATRRTAAEATSVVNDVRMLIHFRHHRRLMRHWRVKFVMQWEIAVSTSLVGNYRAHSLHTMPSATASR